MGNITYDKEVSGDYKGKPVIARRIMNEVDNGVYTWEIFIEGIPTGVIPGVEDDDMKDSEIWSELCKRLPEQIFK